MATSNRKTPDSPALIWQYVGAGRALPDIPARDLTVEEAAALPAVMWRFALALELYTQVEQVTAPAADGEGDHAGG